MKKILLSFFAVALVFTVSLCQDKKDTVKIDYLTGYVKKWQLGVNTQFAFDKFLNQGVQTPFEVIVKYQTQRHTAWRANLIANYNRTEGSGTITNSTRIERNLGLTLLLGKEWIKPISSKWYLYYGVSARLGYATLTRDFLNSKGPFTDVSTGKEVINNAQLIDETIYYGFQPFLGFRYQVSQTISLSFESSLIWVNSQTNFSVSEVFVFTDGSGSRQFSSGSAGPSKFSTNIYFQPYTGFYLIIKI